MVVGKPDLFYIDWQHIVVATGNNNVESAAQCKGALLYVFETERP